MGINIPGEFKLRIRFFSIFFRFFFFSAKMNLTVFAGILLAVTMATARRASLGEKTMQAASKADEPAEAKRANGGCKPVGTPCNNRNECCNTPYVDCYSGVDCGGRLQPSDWKTNV